MQRILATILLCICVFITAYSQKREVTSFVILFKKSFATKGGFLLNGYVVNISAKQADLFNNRTVRISGDVTIIEGLEKRQMTDAIIQGRLKDTKYILKPSIKVIQ